jgi:uncharacterized protein
MEYFLCVLGMVMVVEGLPYFGFPDKMKAFLQVVLEQDDATLRMVGAIVMALGVLIVFISRKGLAGL